MHPWGNLISSSGDFSSNWTGNFKLPENSGEVPEFWITWVGLVIITSVLYSQQSPTNLCITFGPAKYALQSKQKNMHSTSDDCPLDQFPTETFLILKLVEHVSDFPGWSPRANQRWTALFQRFHKFQRWSALFQNGLRKSALFSAGSKRSEKPTKMLRVSSKRYWDHEKHVLLERTSYEKNHSGEILVKNSNWRTRLFLMLLGRTWPVE